MKVKVCGPKLSAVGVVLSLWGVAQLSVMAIAFYFNSVTFIEDLNIPEEVGEEPAASEEHPVGPDSHHSPAGAADVMRKNIEVAYGQTAENCGIAVLLYVVTLLFSLHQMWVNHPDDFVNALLWFKDQPGSIAKKVHDLFHLCLGCAQGRRGRSGGRHLRSYSRHEDDLVLEGRI